MSSIPGIQPETDRRPRRGRKVIGLFLVIVTASLGFPAIIYLLIPATMPPTVTLDPASSLSSFNVSGPRVTVEWILVFSIENPSKLVPVKYAHTKATIYLDSTPLAHAEIGPFVQEAASHANVQASVHSPLPSVDGFYLKILVSSLQRGELRVDVVFSSGRKLGLGAWWVTAFDVSATCNDLIFITISDGGSLKLHPATGYCVLGFFSYI